MNRLRTTETLRDSMALGHSKGKRFRLSGCQNAKSVQVRVFNWAVAFLIGKGVEGLQVRRGSETDWHLRTRG